MAGKRLPGADGGGESLGTLRAPACLSVEGDRALGTIQTQGLPGGVLGIHLVPRAHPLRRGGRGCVLTRRDEGLSRAGNVSAPVGLASAVGGARARSAPAESQPKPHSRWDPINLRTALQAAQKPGPGSRLIAACLRCAPPPSYLLFVGVSRLPYALSRGSPFWNLPLLRSAGSAGGL